MKNLLILFMLLPIFGLAATPTTVRTADKVYYEQYKHLCDSMVLDTCLMVGYQTIPLGTVTYVNKYTYTNPDGTKVVREAGTYLTQKRVLNSSSYSNPLRKRTYKNVNKTVTAKPTVTATREICWFPVSYMCKYRKSSIRDFYEWYWLQVLKKPKFWT